VRIIRVQLEGPDAEPGRVQAADVARLIVGVERAIARAAYIVLGKPWRGTGRHSQAIESAARLRFVGVEKGSFVEVLALPDATAPTEDELPIAVADLSSMAFDRLLEAIVAGGSDTDPELAAAVAGMAAELGIGERNTSVVLTSDAEPVASAPRRAVIDVGVRRRMQELSSRTPSSRDQTLIGMLVEADFEGHTARLRLADGTAVTVNFSADLADEIQEALRSRASFEGAVRYHPKTSEAISVELRAVIRATQLALDAEAFWQTRTFSELQAVQGASGRVLPTDLAILDLTDEERTSFLSELAE